MKQNRHSHFGRHVAAALTIAGMALAPGACSQRTADELAGNEAGGEATDACPVEADNDFGGTVRIAWQAIPNADLIVKDKQLLETCIPNATIEWSQFNSGGDVVQAFGSNSLDLGLAGSSPSVKSVSAPLNLPVSIIWIHDVIGDAESLVTRDSGVSSVADLKGRNIATPFGSTSHFSLLTALDDAGLATSDVNLVNLDPDKMQAAWDKGQIDAAWVWDPVLSELRDAGGTTVTSSAQTAKIGAATYDMEIASSDFIEANPAVIATWTRVEDYAVDLITSKPDEAAESIAAQLALTTDQVTRQFEGYSYVPAAEQADIFDNELPGVLDATAKFLKSQGDLDAVNDDYAAALYTDGLAAAK